MAVLVKDTFGDWSPSEMYIDIPTFPDGAISSNTLADLMTEDHGYWATVKE